MVMRMNEGAMEEEEGMISFHHLAFQVTLVLQMVLQAAGI